MKRKILVPVFICILVLLSGCNANSLPGAGQAAEEEKVQAFSDPSDAETVPEAEEIPEEAVTEEAAAEADPDEEIAKTVETAAQIDEDAKSEEDGYKYTEDGKRIVDLIMFMGQSNMAGAGGNAEYAPSVPYDEGFEFKAVSDPTRLYPITEPFGVNENNLNAIMDLPGAKRGSLVSAFANTYFEETGIPVVGVSASAGATDTAFWMSDAVAYDFTERLQRAIVWLENDNYVIRHKYAVWLQGESDAVDDLSSEQYEENMNVIIRPLFVNGIEKVFFITPGRTITRKDFFKDIIRSQIKMSRESGYYALGTTILSAIGAEYMVDEWHYNQTVLNLVGRECAKSVACYSNQKKEMCVYDYYDQTTFIPDGFDYAADLTVEPLDLADCGLRTDITN
ncbi:MAG: sialate O-acetylesterase [Lachnospiraceae bacterium]|nr:sialate O-acetylesterase [Lachnospiraceae bacterium]